jgi:acetyltransferase-like isoleucine patch superfamily enzyme
MIGGNCQIMDSDGHPLWPLSARRHYPGIEYDAPVDIGDDVYIGLNVLILKGSSIGNGAVIAAGSVVTGMIPPNCLAAGVPAKVIRPLDDQA